MFTATMNPIDVLRPNQAKDYYIKSLTKDKDMHPGLFRKVTPSHDELLAKAAAKRKELLTTANDLWSQAYDAMLNETALQRAQDLFP